MASAGKIRGYFKKTAIIFTSVLLLFILANFLFPLNDTVEYSTIITDNKGQVIHAFLTSDDKWRMKTTLEEISPILRKTIVRKEDKYFYYHPGVNPFSIVRAVFDNLLQQRRTSGASTITMQVARALQPGRRTYLKKFAEVFRALQLEWKYSKDEILLLYLNSVPYGSNIEGVKSASVLYFEKNPDHLSLAEVVTLSIIPNRPSSLVIGKNNDRIIRERNEWLNKFRDEDLFTENQLSDALHEPLNAFRHSAPRAIPHLSGKLKMQGGDLIRTSIEMNTQWKVEKIVTDYTRRLYQKNIRNAAIVVIDNRTNKVISYVGSADFEDTIDAGQVNGAAAIRQPGSTLKPLLYAMCIDEGLLTPRSVLTDVAVNFNGYAPENYDRKFNGIVSMEYALAHSLNIPAVKGLASIGKDKFIQKLATCDFRQIKKDQRKLGLSMVLGGCGATLEELTGLYSVFANGGKYVKPIFRSDDTVRTSTRIISEAATFMIHETLSSVNRPDFPLNWQSTERMPKIAWKTGTSYGRRDAWSIGYNKNYTIGVWIGNFSGQGIPELNGANIATPLLFRIFNTVDYDNQKEWFVQPEDIDIRKVCSETGLPPADHCTQIVTDYFIPLISTTITCNHLREIEVSENEDIAFCKSCIPAAGYKKKWYRNISAEMERHYYQNNLVFKKMPAHNPLCEKIFRDGSPLIVSPANGSEYLLSKKSKEPIQLAATVGNDVSRVYWYINDRFYKTAEAHTRQFFIPEEGPVKISCSDDKGRNRDIWIKVRYVNL